jgi:hypothetical protein
MGKMTAKHTFTRRVTRLSPTSSSQRRPSPDGRLADSTHFLQFTSKSGAGPGLPGSLA